MHEAIIFTLIRRQARLERTVIAMAESLQNIVDKVTQLESDNQQIAADNQAMQQRVSDFQTQTNDKTNALLQQIASLKDQLAAMQAAGTPDFTALGNSLDALHQGLTAVDSSIRSFQAAPEPPVSASLHG